MLLGLKRRMSGPILTSSKGRHMSIWWIKNKDVPVYKDLMHKMSVEERVIETQGNYSLVQFSPPAMTVWVQCGYWYGGSPNALSGFYHQTKDMIKSIFQ